MDEVLASLTAIEWTYADHDLTALAELKRRIAANAQTSDPLQSYSTLVDGVVFHLPNVAAGAPFEINTAEWRSLDRAIIGDFLGRVDADSYRAGAFFASALVVQAQGQRQPSESFFNFATRVGFLRSNTEDGRLRFWSDQVRMSVDWFRAHPREQW